MTEEYLENKLHEEIGVEEKLKTLGVCITTKEGREFVQKYLEEDSQNFDELIFFASNTKNGDVMLWSLNGILKTELDSTQISEFISFVEKNLNTSLTKQKKRFFMSGLVISKIVEKNKITFLLNNNSFLEFQQNIADAKQQREQY